MEDDLVDAVPFDEEIEDAEDDAAEIDLDEEPIDDEFALEIGEDIPAVVEEKTDRIPDPERITYNKLTKYEETALLGARAEQIARGAKILVDIPVGVSDPIEIAKIELKERQIPLKIRRIINEKDKKFEEWNIKDLTF